MNVRFYEWLDGRIPARLIDILDIPEPLPPTWSIPIPVRLSAYTAVDPSMGPTFKRADFYLRANDSGYEYVSNVAVEIASSERARLTDLMDLAGIFH